MQFDVLEILATGAYGTVCIVREKGNEHARELALKVLKSGHNDDPRWTARSRDEARMLSRLGHPHLVRVEPILEVDGRAVVAMEWVEGANLEDLLRARPGGLPVGVALEIVRRAAEGLHAAFSDPVGADGRPMRIVHRDIKPSNILVSVHGITKVVDFGIATGHFGDREADPASVVMGSRGYSAPERHTRGPETPAVDVYALGVLLFELVTGHRLLLSMHADRHDESLARALEHLAPDGLSAFQVKRLRRLVSRMASWDPIRRPRPHEVADALAAFLADGGLEPDMAAFAAERVRPVFDGRERRPPREDPRWPEVAFLAEAPVAGEPRAALPEPAGDPRVADTAIAVFLDRPGWQGRRDDLDALLHVHKAWTARPFVELVRRLDLPWWNVWTRRPSHDEVVVALGLMFHRPGPEVARLAQALAHHEDERVARAARSLTAWGG